MTLSTQSCYEMNDHQTTSVNVLEWLSQRLDLRPIEHHLRRYENGSPSNMMELERCSKEEWMKDMLFRANGISSTHVFAAECYECLLLGVLCRIWRKKKHFDLNKTLI